VSLGKVIGETMVSAARSWNPFGPEAYERRDRNKAYRKARKKAKRGETLTEDEFELLQTYKERPMAIDLGTRTTTNMGVSGLVVWGVMKLISTYVPDAPTEGLEELIAAVVAYVIGYFTKTPAQPKAL
jgi:hypothetical protein